jgi:hypothetical protein
LGEEAAGGVDGDWVLGWMLVGKLGRCVLGGTYTLVVSVRDGEDQVLEEAGAGGRDVEQESGGAALLHVGSGRAFCCGEFRALGAADSGEDT